MGEQRSLSRQEPSGFCYSPGRKELNKKNPNTNKNKNKGGSSSGGLGSQSASPSSAKLQGEPMVPRPWKEDMLTPFFYVRGACVVLLLFLSVLLFCFASILPE